MGFQAYWDVFEQTGSVKAYLEYARRGRMDDRDRFDDEQDRFADDEDPWDAPEGDEDEKDFIRG